MIIVSFCHCDCVPPGYVRRLDPSKPVTNAQAAACLAYGPALEKIEQEHGEREAEKAQKALEEAQKEKAAAQAAVALLKKELQVRKERKDKAKKGEKGS